MDFSELNAYIDSQIQSALQPQPGEPGYIDNCVSCEIVDAQTCYNDWASNEGAGAPTEGCEWFWAWVSEIEAQLEIMKSSYEALERDLEFEIVDEGTSCQWVRTYWQGAVVTVGSAQMAWLVERWSDEKLQNYKNLKKIKDKVQKAEAARQKALWRTTNKVSKWVKWSALNISGVLALLAADPAC